MPIKFSVKIVRLKVYVIFSQSDDLDLYSRSQLRLKLNKCFYLYYNSNISDTNWAMAFKLGMPVDLCMSYIYICSCSFWWPSCNVTECRQREKYERRIISTTKQLSNMHSTRYNSRPCFTWPWLCKHLFCSLPDPSTSTIQHINPMRQENKRKQQELVTTTKELKKSKKKKSATLSFFGIVLLALLSSSTSSFFFFFFFCYSL